MTVVSYTFNNAPLFPAASIFTTPPSSGTPGGYFFGSFTVDFSTDSIISSNFGFTPVGGPSVTFMNPNFLAGTPPGGFPVYTGLWFGSGISGGPDFISTDATGYEANLGWLQSSGITPSTISVNYLGPNSTINTYERGRHGNISRERRRAGERAGLWVRPLGRSQARAFPPWDFSCWCSSRLKRLSSRDGDVF